MGKKIVLIFANCQGGILTKILPQLDNFDIHHIHNYTKIWDNHISCEILTLLKTCDYFIYQPLSNKYPVYNTDNMISYLKIGCKCLSFPYIYNDGLVPVAKILARDFPSNGEYQENGEIVRYRNSEPIIQLKREGKTLADIKELFIQNRINFNYDERFIDSINILKKNEEKCDIKVSDYILKYYKKKNLFNTNTTVGFCHLNHPSNILLIEYANQVIKLMGYSPVEFNEPELIGVKYISTSELNHHKYEFTDVATPNYDDFIFEIITEIYNKDV